MNKNKMKQKNKPKINNLQGNKHLFDFNKMKKIFYENDFSKYGFKKTKLANNQFYWFKDNNSKILAVAHLDSVQKAKSFNYLKVKGGDTFVYSPVLDDRIGVYIMVDVLSRVGINCDILLTTDEEIGNSTAQFFQTTKKYNWGFSFDRAGRDCVCYSYQDSVFEKLLTKSGFILGWGSYSDISDLTNLGCKFFNIGVGYQDYHSINARLSMNDLNFNFTNFCDFYIRNRDKHLKHIPTIIDKSAYGSIWNYWKTDYKKSDYDIDNYKYDYNNHNYNNQDYDFIKDDYYYCDSCRNIVSIGKNVYVDEIDRLAEKEKLCYDCYEQLCNDWWGIKK